MVNVNTKKFYDAGGGERLINPNNYPPDISLFLKQEKSILLEILKSRNYYDTLFEIGCMQARSLKIAVEANVNYVGIDIVPRYIEEANIVINKYLADSNNKTAIATLLSAYELTDKSSPVPNKSVPLAIFPFNSFGNMKDPDLIISNLVRLKYDFIIFTYKNDINTNQIRYNYYKNCNYTNLQQTSETIGIRFTAKEGLDTIAYYQDFIEKTLSKTSPNYNLTTKEFGAIGRYFYGSKQR